MEWHWRDNRDGASENISSRGYTAHDARARATVRESYTAGD